MYGHCVADVIVWNKISRVNSSDTCRHWRYEQVLRTFLYWRGYRAPGNKAFAEPLAKLYAMLPVKLILAPITIFWAIKILIPIETKYLMMIGVMSMLPSMITVCIQAKEYGSDPEYASGGLLLTTIASMITMPTIMGLLTEWMK